MNSEHLFRTLIPYMSIQCDKTFLRVPFFYFVTLTLELAYFLKTEILFITFEQWILELWYLTWTFRMIRFFCWYFWPWQLTFVKIDIVHKLMLKAFLWQDLSTGIKILSLWPWPSLDLAPIGGLSVHKHILFFSG